MIDIRLALMCGIDITIPELQLILHQPKIKEIALIGETDFFIGAQCLNINKNSFVEGKSLLLNTTNFQIFMTIMFEETTRDKRYAVEQLLSLLFPDYKIVFTPRSLIFTKETLTVSVDENNFDILQEVLKQVFCFSNSLNQQQENYNPANEKARQIAEKLMKGRQKVAELNGTNNASVFSQYLSSLSVGLHIPLTDLMELTMFQILDLVERYSLYMNWDIDIRSRLAGASPDGKPENWMKNIH